MRFIQTDIIIEASPQAVWKILMDFEQFPHWNPFIKKISGTAQKDACLSVSIAANGPKNLTFLPRVKEVVPEQSFIWKGKFLLPGLFDGEHAFQLRLQNGKTHFVHQEIFRGLLTYVMPRSFFDRIQANFQAMNHALKKRAEGE